MGNLLLEKDQEWAKQFGQPIVIAGPCSAESEEQMLETARRMDKNYINIFRAGIWKPRTKPGSFEGVGEIGLKWLNNVKKETGFKTATEIANAEHAKLALEYDIDYLWIGARSTVSPFIVQEIAEALKGTKKPVIVKNPVNPDLELWIGALERLAAQGIENLGVIHRGFSTYKKTKYRNKPKWQMALDFKKRLPKIPMLIDPSHIAGNRELLYEVSQQAFDLEYDGIMIESHRNPDEAWSDASQQVTPERVLEIIKAIQLRMHSSDNSAYNSALQTLRYEIDELDQGLLDALAHRMKVSERIGLLKKENNVAIYQPNRWDELLEKAKLDGEKSGLSTEMVEKIYKAIHQASIEIQSKIMIDKK